MASYEYKTPSQSNVSYGETFYISRPAPAIANRIFRKMVDAKSYINDTNGTAVAGLILSVISDSEANNGIYQVVVDPSSPNGLNLHKIGTDSVKSYIKGVENTEKSETDYVSFKSGDQETKIYTISTDMLRNGSLTLVLDGHF